MACILGLLCPGLMRLVEKARLGACRMPSSQEVELLTCEGIMRAMLLKLVRLRLNAGPLSWLAWCLSRLRLLSQKSRGLPPGLGGLDMFLTMLLPLHLNPSPL